MSIQEWLDGPQDYEAGRLLYELHGRNHHLKRTLNNGPNAYNRSALREELVKLHRAGVVQVQVVASAVPSPAPVVETVIAALPAAASPAPITTLEAAAAPLLAALEKEWKPLYKEASFLQSQLEHAKDTTERSTWSHKILDLMDLVHHHWLTGAYVQEHGQLPPVVEVVPPPALDLTDRAAVLKHRNNLRSNISKQKRNAERAAEVAAWRAETQQLTELLKKLDLSE
jgi:hypothetical protein